MLEAGAARLVANLVQTTSMADAAVDWRPFRTWGVFILCLLFSGIGVGLSFLLLGPTITGYRLWGVGLVIAIIMLGISYGAKYASPDARESFTPVDLIQYLSQGFLWPSTWPGLAKFLNITPIEPPTGQALIILHDLFRVLTS